MHVTRRQFVGHVASAAVLMPLPRAVRGPIAWLARDTSHPCVILDCEDGCGLPESVTGFQRALAELGVGANVSSARDVAIGKLLIVPGALTLSQHTLRTVSDQLERGGVVILESGVMFADSLAFRSHRDALREALGIDVAEPLSLWPEHTSSRGVPFVDYTWPRAARVRDFSRAVPVSCDTRHGIARAGGRDVAMQRPHGRGTLIFLGSPLGPALLAGDREGRRWLADVLGFFRKLRDEP